MRLKYCSETSDLALLAEAECARVRCNRESRRETPLLLWSERRSSAQECFATGSRGTKRRCFCSVEERGEAPPSDQIIQCLLARQPHLGPARHCIHEVFQNVWIMGGKWWGTRSYQFTSESEKAANSKPQPPYNFLSTTISFSNKNEWLVRFLLLRKSWGLFQTAKLEICWRFWVSILFLSSAWKKSQCLLT